MENYFQIKILGYSIGKKLGLNTSTIVKQIFQVIIVFSGCSFIAIAQKSSDIDTTININNYQNVSLKFDSNTITNTSFSLIDSLRPFHTEGKLMAKNDSLKISRNFQKQRKDSTSKVSFHGIFNVEGYYSNGTFYAQEQPAFYVRSYLDYTLKLWGVPINSKVTLVGDDFMQMKNISGMSFSLDKDFIKSIENFNGKFKSVNLNNKITDSLGTIIGNFIAKKNTLEQKINSKSYLNEIAKSKKIIQKSITDSIFKKRNEFWIKKSNKIIYDHQNNLRLIDTLEQLIDKGKAKISYYSNLSRILSIQNSNPIDSGLNILRRKKGFPKNHQSIFASIRKLEIMDIYPSHSDLIFTNVSLRGINIELNPRKYYFGYCIGINNQNSILNDPFQLKNKDFIQSIKFGLGDLDKSSFGIIYLRGKPDTLFSYFPEGKNQFNQVIGFQTSIKFSDYLDIQFEKAWSNTYDNLNNIDLISLLKSINQNKYNSSNLIKSSIYIKKFKTKLSTFLCRTDQLFYTIGNPYLRQDALRLNGRIDQAFLKGTLNSYIDYKRDVDNLSNSKKYTTVTNQFEAGSDFRIKKSYTRVLYKRIITKNDLVDSMLNLITNLNTTFTFSSKFLKKNLQLIVNHNLMRIENNYRTNSINWVNMFTNTNLYFANKSLTLMNSNVHIIKSNSSDSGNTISNSFGFSLRSVKRTQISLSIKRTQIKDALIQYSITPSFGYSFKSLKFNLNGDYHKIIYSEVEPKNSLFTIRMNIIYCF